MATKLSPPALLALVASTALLMALDAGCLWRSGLRQPPPWAGQRGDPPSLKLPDDPQAARPASNDPNAAGSGREPERFRAVFTDGKSWIRGARTSETIHVPQASEGLQTSAVASEAATLHRWRYPNLEDLLARPAEERPDLKPFLADDDPIVAANAAIGLARLGDSSGMEVLAKAVKNSDLRLEMRCAAAEALAGIRRPSPVALLGQLADRFGGADARRSPQYVPELDAELLRGLARHADAAAEPRFTEALASPSPEVTLAALEAWRSSHGSLPKQMVPLRSHPDPRVRADAVATLALRGGRESLEYVRLALDDTHLVVRQAAVHALGEMGGPEAEAILGKLLQDPSEPMRAAAVEAMATLGRREAVLGAAGDKSWQVRLEVARALALWPDHQAAAAARTLLDDRSPDVAHQAVAAVSRWPLALAGPVLLDAMGKGEYLTRRLAAEHLAPAWPPAGEFLFDAPADQRAKALNDLRRRFQQEIGSSGEAALARFDSSGRNETLPAEVVADIEKQLRRLESADAMTRRIAAEELAAMAKRGAIPHLARQRLADLGSGETDPLVWLGLLAVVGEDATEPSLRLVAAAMAQPAAEVRRRACEYLARHPDPKHVPLLLGVLEDQDVSVARVAVRALGLSGPGVDPARLKRLLSSPSEPLRAEAALALARLGDPSGGDALERLAYSSDDSIRLQVAVAMGELGRPEFLPFLIRFLDDRQSIRRAALQSLPKVAKGVESQELRIGSEQSASSAERIEAWKRWFAREHAKEAIIIR